MYDNLLYQDAISGKKAIAHLNFINAKYEKTNLKKFVSSKPYLAFFDPVSFCNLRCPFCETGRRVGSREGTKMPLENYKHMLEHIGDYLYNIKFYNWGEPFFNDDLPEMIRLAKSYSIFTDLSTNLSLTISDEKIENIISSGLDFLLCSIDGASQETYQKYRVGGDFELVMKNLNTFIKKKKEMQSKRPQILWRYFVFKHNEMEIDKAKKIAEDLGVQIFFDKPYIMDYLNPENWISTISTFSEQTLVRAKQVAGSEADYVLEKGEKKQIESNYGKPCDWLWSTLTVNANGSVSPCCAINFEKDDFGKIVGSSDEIWNNEKFQTARAFFKNGQIKNDVICTKCPVPAIQHIPQLDDQKIFEFLEKSPSWLEIMTTTLFKDMLPQGTNLAKYGEGFSKLLCTYSVRDDLQKAFPDIFTHFGLFQLLLWAIKFGIAEYPTFVNYVDVFKRCSRDEHRLAFKTRVPPEYDDAIFDLTVVYLERTDLQKTFPEVRNMQDLSNLIRWGYEHGIHEDNRLFNHDYIYRKYYNSFIIEAG
jgi:radical SAM protein with 4Fe4S-binding SPASM domain